MLRKGDIILIGFVALILILSFTIVQLYKSSEIGTHKVAIIKQGDRLIKKIDIDAVHGQQRFEIVGDYNMVILAETGKLTVEAANCPDQVCVRTGWLSKKGDTAVCLPNKTIVKIEGELEKVDGISS